MRCFAGADAFPGTPPATTAPAPPPQSGLPVQRVDPEPDVVISRRDWACRSASVALRVCCCHMRSATDGKTFSLPAEPPTLEEDDPDVAAPRAEPRPPRPRPRPRPRVLVPPRPVAPDDEPPPTAKGSAPATPTMAAATAEAAEAAPAAAAAAVAPSTQRDLTLLPSASFPRSNPHNRKTMTGARSKRELRRPVLEHATPASQ